MSNNYNFRLNQVRPKNGSTNSSFTGTVQFEFHVPLGHILLPQKCFLGVQLKTDYYNATPALAPLPTGVGISKNPISAFWLNTQTDLNDTTISFCKDIPAAWTSLRQMNAEYAQNKTSKSGSPLIPFGDVILTNSTMEYGSATAPAVLNYSNSVEATTMECGLRNYQDTLTSIGQKQVWITGQIPSALWLSQDDIHGNNKVLLTLNVDPNWRNNLFTSTTGAAVNVTDTNTAAVAGTPAIRVDVADLVMYCAMQNTNHVPRSLSVSYNIRDPLSYTYQINNITTNATFNLQEGCDRCYIFFGSSNRGSSTLYPPSSFRSLFQLLGTKFRVSFNSRPLMNPDLDLGNSYAGAGATAFNIITTGENRRSDNLKDWKRAWEEMIFQTNSQASSSIYDYGTWLAEPIFQFELVRMPGEQGNQLDIYLDMASSSPPAIFGTAVGLDVGASLAANPLLMYIVAVQNKQVTVNYNSDSYPESTQVSFLR